jgi:hypothetical protein
MVLAAIFDRPGQQPVAMKGIVLFAMQRTQDMLLTVEIEHTAFDPVAPRMHHRIEVTLRPVKIIDRPTARQLLVKAQRFPGIVKFENQTPVRGTYCGISWSHFIPATIKAYLGDSRPSTNLQI